ncbi:MAG: hypothetical protein AAFN70_06465 [Planctomycetota bacterium]
MRRIGALKDGEEQVGQRVRAKIVKNKVAPPFLTIFEGTNSTHIHAATAIEL